MRPEVWSDLIGRPFRHEGRGPDAFDCLGLVLEVERRLGFPAVDPIGSYPEDWAAGGDDLILTRYAEGWRRVPDGQERPGDVVALRWDSPVVADHLGILAAPGRLLHARRGVGVVEQRLPRERVVGYFRPREPAGSGAVSRVSAPATPSTCGYVSVRTVPNALSADGRALVLATHDGGPIPGYAPEGYGPETARAILNGRAIPPVEWGTTIPGVGDELILIAEPRGPAIAALIPALTTATGALTTGGLVVAAAINIVIGLGIGLIASLLTAPPKAARREDEEGSPTYDLSGVQNSYRPGGPLPVVYGQRTVGGLVIQQFFRVREDGKSVLYVLLALSQGAVKEIGGAGYNLEGVSNDLIPDSIKINGNPASSYKGVSVWTRLGTTGQEPIAGFSSIVNAVPFSVTLDDGTVGGANSFVYQTSTPVDGFEALFYFPSGLIQISPNGNPQNYFVTYVVRWRLIGSTTWSSSGNVTIIRSTTVPFSAAWRKDGLAYGRYEIEITRTAPVWPDTGIDSQSTFQLTAINEIVSDDLSYPNVALLALTAVATDQLSGAVPTITCDVQGKTVWVYDGVSPIANPTLVLAWTDNPAWIAMDILTNPIYGLGNRFRYSDIDFQSFVDASVFFQEMVNDGRGSTIARASVNAVFDFTSKGWDAANSILAPFRAGLIQYGRKVKIKIEKAVGASQLFTMGNIAKGSFSIAYRSPRDAANLIEVQFANEETNYEADTATREDLAAIDADGVRPRTVSLFGVTHPSRAARAAQFMLNAEQTLLRTCSFKVAIDALAVEPGDVIALQHDVPSWGTGGRIKSATSSDVVIDQPLTVISGTTKIRVRTDASGDNVQERTINATSGDYFAGETLSITPNWDAGDVPAAGDVYAAGSPTDYVTYWRVVKVSIDSDLMASLDCIEYDSTIYSDDPGSVETFTDEIPDPLAIPDPVTDLRLREKIINGADGSVFSAIIAFWAHEKDAEVAVYYREADSSIVSEDSGWRFAGSSKTGALIIQDDLDTSVVYEVSVSPLAPHWTAAGFDPKYGTRAVIGLLGKETPPPNVTDLAGTVIERVLFLSWNCDRSSDVVGYQVRTGKNGWWGATIIADFLESDAFTMPVSWVEGATVMVKAIDRVGNLSDLEAELLVSSDILDFAVDTDQSEGTGWSGTKTDTTVVSGALELDTSSALEGTYVASVTPAGGLARYRILFLAQPGIKALDAVVARCLYRISSEYASRRLVNGSGSMEGLEFQNAERVGTNYGFIGDIPGQIHKVAGMPDLSAYEHVVLEYRTSPNSGSSWSNWNIAGPAVESFDLLEMRATLTTPHEDIIPYLESLRIVVAEAPNLHKDRSWWIDLHGGSISDANSGTSTLSARNPSIGNPTDRDQFYVYAAAWGDSQVNALAYTFPVPTELDVSKPISAKVFFHIATTGTGTVEVVNRFSACADTESVTAGGYTNSSSATIVATSYGTNALMVVDLGEIIAGGVISANEIIRGTIARDSTGGNANDTFTGQIRPLGMIFTGTLK